MLNDGEKGAVLQRDRKTYGIAPHLPCGVVTAATLRKLADVAEKYQVPMIKVTSAARIALLGIPEEQVDAVWADLGMDPGHVVGICIRSVKACPGTTFCKRGQQDSLGVGLELDEKFHGQELPGKMKIGVSGCPFQCAETSFKDIGLVGTAKGWRVLVGGNGGASPRLADTLAQRIDTHDAVGMVVRILEYYRAHAQPKERMGKLIERLGLTHMEEALGLGRNP
ncbi:MAG TPA: NAD(P)/FAD-dependent oxidoreductase [Candidatus Paceibacterota bacterium]|nr:NAD(P)/FAD-dependent oxidoreductase [Verrucomicrobiota bacterium]HRZ47036.1 NAD(P)/FAD-dependent oxidoreductase [Candidatus Paceibacterota bacterium]HRZ93243.1 NAD(P)/FAD-dependent oxidoreductase [Candidatus Paceibacterota bacterium]